MGIFDAILLIIIAIFGFRGFLKGLVMELFGFIAIFVAFFVSYEYSAFFAKGFGFFGSSEKTNGALGYLLAFVLSYILVLMIGLFISKMFKEVKMGWANKGGGAVFGAFKAAAIIGVFLSMLLTALPLDSKFSQYIEKGPISGTVAKLAPFVFDMMNKIPSVKKDNPFERTAMDRIKEKIDNATESVKNAADTVKNASEKADKVDKAVKSAPLKDLQDDFNKN